MNSISSYKYSEDSAIKERILTEERIMKFTITTLSKKLFASLLAVLVIASITGISQAAEVNVYLQTQSFDKTLTNGETVPMWGFASCPDANFTGCTLDAPGPQIDANVGDVLNININNTLPVPVSVVIPGQISSGNPTPLFDSSGRQRVGSFTQEVAANSVGTYNWSSLKAGTYMYQSGTYPSIQVPMGLYGALVVQQDGAQPYTGISVDTESVLLFSEVDPVQNKRVAETVALSPVPPITPQCVSLIDYKKYLTTGYPCTVDYDPVYFFINGAATADLSQAPGANVLVRFINAGLRSHSPFVIGSELELIAEDGNLYPGLPRKQNEVLLAAGKTIDAKMIMPATDATLKLADHMPSFNNANQSNETSLGSVTVGAGATPPEATPSVVMDDSYNVTEDTALDIDDAGIGVLANDTITTVSSLVVVQAPANGTVNLNIDGTFIYTPNPDFSGKDYFTYSADGNNAQVELNVSFVNDAPTAAADGPYTNTVGTDINVTAPGVLANDTDLDGDTLTAVLEGPAPSGLTLNPDGSFAYTGAVSTSFSYRASDGQSTSDPIVVSLTSNPVSGIALSVVNPDDVAVDNYRWTVEEDINWQPDPNNIAPTSETLATNFHKSNMPVVAQGNGAAEFAQLALDPTKHYYVSVLPADAASSSGHTIGGAKIVPGATVVTVTVNKTPLKTAQISVFVFEDNSPTNAAVDANENGLGGFQITVEDGGGRYGISAGTLAQDAFGNPLENALDCFGASPPEPGVILSCPDTPDNQARGIVGEVLIKNLYQGKYGITATSPAGSETKWVQTTTIEGSKISDAWVKAGEPAYFQEFGPAGWHVFVGFVSPEKLAAQNPGGTNSVTGKVTNMHMSRPPNQTLYDSGSYDAMSHTRAWIGINSANGTGPNFGAVQADEDGNFTLSGIPDGDYQLVVWDAYLDLIIGYKAVSLPTGGNVGNVPVFQWFTRSEHNVFLDVNQNGVRDEGELPVPEQNVNLRWRDGTVYQAFPTDSDGFVPFDETFPFFHWLVQEVDYARFKATGLTVTVDAGGDVSTTGGVLNPQVQADGGLSRTEIGQVLTQGYQGFLGQTSIFDWGKAPYEPGENGGISGIVYYSSTRAENNPRLAAAEPWEPGIPSVTVRLYREVEKADGSTGLVLVQETETDSWDKSLPSGCPGADPSDIQITGGPASNDKCYDGLRNFNQARPAVFDGGYAFNDIPAGKYIVEVAPPPGYELVKEESNNVGFGDSYDVAPVPVTLPGGAAVEVPDAAMVQELLDFEPGLAQPACVGKDHVVAPYLTLFPGEMVDSPYANSVKPLCDRKQVVLDDQGQAAADFFLYTSAPISGHFVGMILDDIAQEFNPLSPQFGEKWAPPFVPVSVRDHHGKEISRLYSDQWGRYNGLVPSTFTANMPSPSGYAPNMLMTCMNDPGPIPDPDNPGQMIVDPQYNPVYSNFCYTFQYMPGTTTYLDTPVLPVASYASGYNPADCSLEEASPMIRQVNGTGNGPLVAPNGTLTIYSHASKQVPNPEYTGPLGSEPKTVTRHFGFGNTTGTVSIGGVPVVVTGWSDVMIQVTAPANEMEGELVVTRGDNGKSTERAITVSVSTDTPVRVPEDYPTIQQAIDAAAINQLVIVGPGNYEELVIMWKPVRLQGAGAGVTVINGVKRPTEKIAQWREKMDCLFGIGSGCSKRVDAVDNQADGAVGFETEEGAAITVVAASGGALRFRGRNSRIDGFAITGADIGGGIFINGYAHQLEISNNNIFGNQGSYHGGIRVGQLYLELADNGPYAFNEHVNIHHNDIIQNGGLGGAGGGLSIATGTDRYQVEANFICGNFTMGSGAGIGHLGLSDKGTIKNNRIVFNQTFNQAQTQSGGGLFISGEPAAPGALTFGSGSVSVDSNTIKGNQAAAGHGGGIRTQFVNGQEILDSNLNNGNPRIGRWYQISMTNNMITNNVAGWSGGGISMQDTANSHIVNNTIANNDSTATVGPLVNVNVSQDQPAGISSEPHSTGLIAAIPTHPSTSALREFSNPELVNNIVWHNRSFHYDSTSGQSQLIPVLSQSAIGDCPAGANYWDLGVLGGTGSFKMNPVRSILTDITGYDASNISGNPAFLSEYCNGGRSLAGSPGAMFPLPALDEMGAAWIDVRFGPLIPLGDYHIASTSAGLNNGNDTSVNNDIDGDPRPIGTGTPSGYDRGADEFVP